ncbi:hypothetical protein KP509_15G019100 [Ceratopteris richardii]|uniref:Ubiquitin-like domain-containing protein n=1 Tax=Ceratopteris richardii TaxID=49495 RepID=A0A8T2T659_CERRI|nr:hypothetical protein KP509_15G019100 [Ceratopteris richardii]
MVAVQYLRYIVVSSLRSSTQFAWLCVTLQAMFIRVKRKKTTYFLHCEPSDTTLEIKSKLQVLTDQDVDAQRLILVSNQLVLEDARTLAEQRVDNDAVVALTFKKDSGEWEDIDIEKPDDRTGAADLEGS